VVDRAVVVSEAGVVLDLLADFRDPQEVVEDLTAETAHQEVAVAHEVVADSRIKDTIRVIIKVTTVVDGTVLHHGEVHLAAVPEVAVLVVTAVAADSAVVEVLEGAVVVLEVAVAAVDEEDRIEPSLSFKNPSGVL